jgi:methyl coenzyme M reductase alpha subunit
VKKLVEKIREKKLKEKVLEGWKNESKKNEFVRLGRKYL